MKEVFLIVSKDVSHDHGHGGGPDTVKVCLEGVHGYGEGGWCSPLPDKMLKAYPTKESAEDALSKFLKHMKQAGDGWMYDDLYVISLQMGGEDETE